MEAKKFPEITDNFFKREPFIIQLKEGELTSSMLDDIYKESNSFKKVIANFEISNEKYDISFIKNNDLISFQFYKNNKIIYVFDDFLLQPKELNIDIDNLDTKSMKIYTLTAYNLIKRIFLNNGKYTLTENESLNIIELRTKVITIPDDIIDIYLNIEENNKNYQTLINLKNNITFNPLFLSSNFYDIFPEVENSTNFELILNDERKLLLKKLKLFIESNKKYYWFIGSDGIGKSITLLYFASLKNYKVVYFNLKLYVNSSKEEVFHQFFYKDIQRFYIKDIKTKEYSNGINFNYSQNIKRIEKSIKKNYDPDLSLFWNYIYNFIITNLGKDYIIIFDQYKSEKYDYKFKGLNKIVNTIRNYNANIKLILSTSINNTDSKENFIKNLDNIYNIEDLPFPLEQILEIEINNPEKNSLLNSDFEEVDNNIKFDDEDDDDNQSDCSFCQNMIVEEQKKFKKNTINKEKEKIIIGSECALDQIYSKTQRDYYCSLVSGKELYKKLLKEEEYIIAKNFNYNLKYITKYIKFKKIESKKGNKKINDIINKFYKIESEKMKIKIDDFYQEIRNKLKNTNDSNEYDLEFKNLCKLRSYIIEDYNLSLTDLIKELYYFPMKYLNITLFPLNTNYFSLNQDLSDYKFKIRYNNNFTRIQINCIINEIFRKITNFSLNSLGGSALGNYLEIKVDETFRNDNYEKFGYYKYDCRYLFSLVHKTKNSPNTIKEHRMNEKNLITQFFGEQYYNKIIDDIDEINDNKHFILNKNLYYFSQISFTGRAFDMAVLKKVKNNVFILFLFQVSKNKKNELKSKIMYILEANNVLNYLASIYHIEINEIYLTFILPNNSITDVFQKNLNDNGFNYVFFDLHTNKFFDKINRKEINFLELQESKLDYNPYINIYDLQNIIIKNNIWEKSIKKFLNRKLNRDDFEEKDEEEDNQNDIITKLTEKGDSLHKIYINDLFNSEYYGHIKLLIPKDLEIKIKKDIIGDEQVKLKFLNNFDIVNINEVKNLYRCLIIFNKNNNIYFYYEHLYLFNNNKFKKIINENEILYEKTEFKKRNTRKRAQVNKKSKEKNLNKNADKKSDFPPKKSNKRNKSQNKKNESQKKDETKSINMKENILNDIKEKNIKIDIFDLNKEEYEGKCFCFLIMSKNYVKKFFDL